MSIQAVAWVLDHERDTTGVARLVLLALANYANKTGEAWPAVGTLAADCNCSERQVRYALRQLCELDILRQVGRADDPRIRGDRRPFKYRIRGVQPLQVVESTGGKIRPNGGQSTAARGAMVAPKPSNEPSKNRRRTFLPGSGWVEERSNREVPA